MKKTNKILIKYLNFFTKLQIKKQKSVVIVVTGTVGKTGIKNLLVETFKSAEKKVYYSKNSYNSDFGIPFTILRIGGKSKLQKLLLSLIKPLYILIFDWKKYDYLVLEKGVQEPGDMDLLKEICTPKFTISTNIHTAHTEFFASRKDYVKEKIKILSQGSMNTKHIVNFDDETIKKEFEKINLVGKLVKISEKTENVQYRYSKTENNITINNEKYQVPVLNKLPNEYATNFALSIACALENKISKKAIERGLENYKEESGRFSIFEGINENIIIDSTYNASPISVKVALKYLQKNSKSKKKILCLGDMRELGKYTQKEHVSLVDYINRICDVVYFVGPNSYKYIYTNKQLEIAHKQHFKNSKLLGRFLKNSEIINSTILFKGSQNNIFMEEAIKFVLKNKIDCGKLCRQEKYWVKIKNDYFKKNS